MQRKPKSPDADLLKLGAEFEAWWSAEREFFATEHSIIDEKERERQAKACMDRTSAVVARILALPALTVEGLFVKVRAVMWCHCGRLDVADQVRQAYATDTKLVWSITGDLATIAGYPLFSEEA